jgi:hypothetical protein
VQLAGENPGPSTVIQESRHIPRYLGYLPEPADSNRLLEVFKEQFLPHFPFIVIPTGMSSQELRAQKPWLYKAIVMVANCEDRGYQTAMNEHIISEISRAMLLRGEKSVDTLQSLIILNSWQVPSILREV